MRKLSTAVLAAVGVLALSGCVSNAIKMFDPARRVPVQLYQGPVREPQTVATLTLISELDVHGDPNNTIGWGRILEIDGVNVEKEDKIWAHVLPGAHTLRIRCRPGPRYSTYREETASYNDTFEAGKTYIFTPELRTSATERVNGVLHGYGACGVITRWFDKPNLGYTPWMLK